MLPFKNRAPITLRQTALGSLSLVAVGGADLLCLHDLLPLRTGASPGSFVRGDQMGATNVTGWHTLQSKAKLCCCHKP